MDKKEKPLVVAIEDAKMDVAKTIETSGLPAKIWLYILNELGQELNDIAKIQYQQQLEEYNKTEEENKTDAE